MKCAAIHGHRKHKDFCNVDTNLLPKAVLNGIPPALTASLTLPPWGKSHADIGSGSTDELPTVSGPHNLKHATSKEHIVNVPATGVSRLIIFLLELVFHVSNKKRARLSPLCLTNAIIPCAGVTTTYFHTNNCRCHGTTLGPCCSLLAQQAYQPKPIEINLVHIQ